MGAPDFFYFPLFLACYIKLTKFNGQKYKIFELETSAYKLPPSNKCRSIYKKTKNISGYKHPPPPPDIGPPVYLVLK